MSTNGQDNPWHEALVRLEQRGALVHQMRVAAWVGGVSGGGLVVEGLNVIATHLAQRAGQDPYWWVLGTLIFPAAVFIAASIRFAMVNHALCVLREQS